MYLTGKGRSLQGNGHEALPFVDKVAATNELINDYSDANSFDLDGHLAAIRSHHNKRSANSRRQYVLFILDSSGSIGSSGFTMMKEVLTNLLPLFCGNTLFGVMSYGSRLERDICFNCDQTDRSKLYQALRSIVFHNAGATRSGDAIQCACDYMLSRSCGYFNEPNSITDVIFLTDGQSNSGKDVCVAAKCFADGVNVVPIGVGNNIDFDELECIEGNNSAAGHIFDVNNIAGLQTLQEEVVQYIIAKNEVCKSI